MSDHEDFNIDIPDAPESVPSHVSALRKGEFVMLKGRPCKITEMSTSTVGKHGDAKVHIVGVDLFTAEKFADVLPSTQNVVVPNVERKEYSLIYIDDGFVVLMDDLGDIRKDLNLPDGEVGKEIQKKYDKKADLMVIVLKTMGEEKVVGVKPLTGA